MKRVVDLLEDGEWITGGLWGAYEQWALGAAASTKKKRKVWEPQRWTIDDITVKNPCLLYNYNRNLYLANTVALKLAGLDQSPALEGMFTDKKKQITGLMNYDSPAVEKIRSVVTEKSHQRLMDENRAKVWTPHDVLTKLVLDPYFAPGKGWHYSNTNYTVLGMIIAEITGNRISEEFRRRIYQPLGLNSTFLDAEETIIGNIATFWVDIDDDDILDEFQAPRELRICETSSAYTSGGLFASSRDCARFTHKLLRGDLITMDSLNQMLDFNLDLPPDFFPGYGYGVSLYPTRMTNGALAWGHTGNAFHISTSAYLPDLMLP